MTREEQKVYDAAKRYIQFCTPVNFGLLVTAVMDVPMSQWPKGTCAHKAEHVLKSVSASLDNKVSESFKPQSIVGQRPGDNIRSGPYTYGIPTKPELGDAAHPDKIIELETSKEPIK